MLKPDSLRPIAILLLSTGLAACASRPAPEPTRPPSPTNWQVTMHRSVCFGRCPSYTVTVGSDGAIRFVGERYVAAQGEQTATAEPEALEHLQDRLAPGFLDSLADSYLTADKACGVWATDFPTISIDLVADGHERHIRHYLGCERAPQALRDLETAVDAAADVMRWTRPPNS